MTKTIEVKVPDIGDATEVDIIEILVNVGDEIQEGDSLITLESDKASMDVPSSHAGIVEALLVKVGDKVSEGSVILTITSVDTLGKPIPEKKESSPPKQSNSVDSTNAEAVEAPPKQSGGSTLKEIKVPDIGDAKDVDVIDVMVKVGDDIHQDDPIITLEGDKATMDIPSPFEGKVESCHIKVGDKASEGTLIISLSVKTAATTKEKESVSHSDTVIKHPERDSKKTTNKPSSTTHSVTTGSVYASPSVRRIAREFGIDLSLVQGTGRKSRILHNDVKDFVKKSLSGGPTMGQSLPEAKAIDFSKYGHIENQSLNKIKRITAKNMHAAWVTIPHVTQFDEADITELEAFRQKEKEAAIKAGYKLTPLAFIVKACVSALKKFPQFNSSLSPNGETLILKQYYNVGIAVDTPNGLVVPVIREADNKSIGDIAREMGELGEKARKNKLMPSDMSGGSFTISSLGGISGTAFTPIVNMPEVAILGISRTKWQPVLKGSDFIPRLMLPLSLSYDHRVIDGAEAARFTLYLTKTLSDIRTLLL